MRLIWVWRHCERGWPLSLQGLGISRLFQAREYVSEADRNSSEEKNVATGFCLADVVITRPRVSGLL